MKTINGIFKLMMGVSILIFALAAFSYASKPAQAEVPSMNKTFMQPQNTSGKYSFQYVCGMDGNDKFYWQVATFNNQTGNLEVYRWDKTDQDWKTQFGKPLPSTP